MAARTGLSLATGLPQEILKPHGILPSLLLLGSMGDNGKENGNYYSIGIIVGCCQNYGPVLGTLNIRCCSIIGSQKGTIILTTDHITFITIFASATNLIVLAF